MPARNPEELDRLFSDALNSGNLDALVALYEPQATLTPEPSQVVTGTQAIREALSAFVAVKPTLTLEVKTPRPDRGHCAHLCQVGTVRDRV